MQSSQSAAAGQTVDQYLAAVLEPARSTLNKVRAIKITDRAGSSLALIALLMGRDLRARPSAMLYSNINVHSFQPFAEILLPSLWKRGDLQGPFHRTCIIVGISLRDI